MSLYDARIASGMSGKDLAEKAEVTASFISDIEMGNRTATAKVAKRIIEAVGRPKDRELYISIRLYPFELKDLE